jgi:hypothetical protein
MALVMLTISACFSDTELRIKNNTTAQAWVSINGTEPVYINSKRTHSAYVSSPQVVKLEYNGYHLFENTQHIDMTDGNSATFSLEPTAGAMKIHNSSVREVRSVNFSPANQNNWGADLLSGVLQTGQNQTFSLTPGFWDVKIRDSHNNYYYYPNQEIILDRTRELIFFAL